jgi:chromosome segregation ATPase
MTKPEIKNEFEISKEHGWVKFTRTQYLEFEEIKNTLREIRKQQGQYRNGHAQLSEELSGIEKLKDEFFKLERAKKPWTLQHWEQLYKILQARAKREELNGQLLTHEEVLEKIKKDIITLEEYERELTPADKGG